MGETMTRERKELRDTKELHLQHNWMGLKNKIKRVEIRGKDTRGEGDGYHLLLAALLVI
jgi:hypothetical protein